MIRKFCLTLAVISTAFISIVSAQQTGKVTASGIGYLEYLPQGYHSNSNKYPVVISLHGIKEKGTPSTDRNRVLKDLEKVDNVGLPKYVKFGAKYPFILISPQLKSNHGSWPASYVMEVLNHVRKELRIDERRIYLTGLSLGGFGVWRTAGEYPDVFAAIAPVCPGGNALSKADEIAAKNLPIWGFHGSNDRIVSYQVTTKMINAINNSSRKPNPLAKATIFPGMGHIIWDRAYQQTNVLDWMLSHRKGSAPSQGNDNEQNEGGGKDDDDDKDDDKGEEKPSNKAPVAKAGGDRTLTLPANSLYIQGSGRDEDGKITSYRWTKISGGSASLNGTSSARLRASNLREGTYVFRLTVEDNDGATRSDDMRVVVKKANKGSNDKDKDKDNNSSKNILPVASAGPDRVITLPTNSVTIQGRASDKDGRIVSYEWAKTYGHNVSFAGANSSRVRIYNLSRGIYIFRLRVKDNDGGVRDDYFKITVKDREKAASNNNNSSKNKGNASTGRSKTNAAPYASAGPDRVVSLPKNAITIRANASDRDGKIVSYLWEKTYGNRASLSGARTPQVRISNLQSGIYIFRLTVKDDDGAATKDYFKVTVKDTGVAIRATEANSSIAGMDRQEAPGDIVGS